jgi:hypothetical protein
MENRAKPQEPSEYCVEIIASKKNMVPENEIDNILRITLQNLRLSTEVLKYKTTYISYSLDEVKIKLSIISPVYDDMCFAALELFVHLLGNIKISYRKTRYGNVF